MGDNTIKTCCVAETNLSVPSPSLKCYAEMLAKEARKSTADIPEEGNLDSSLHVFVRPLLWEGFAQTAQCEQSFTWRESGCTARSYLGHKHALAIQIQRLSPSPCVCPVPQVYILRYIYIAVDIGTLREGGM